MAGIQLHAASPLFVADSVSAAEQEKYEQSQEQRASYFSKEKWEQARKDIRYTQQKEEVKEQKETTTKAQPFKFPDLSFLQVFFYVIPVLLLSLILYYIGKSISPHYFTKKIPPSFQTSEPVSSGDFLLTDFEIELNMALTNSDFPLATHLLHLMLLQQLVAAGQVAWRRDQTNRDILFQIKKEDIRREVKKLFLTYEIIWYGQKTCTEAAYLDHATACRTFFTTLQTPAQP